MGHSETFYIKRLEGIDTFLPLLIANRTEMRTADHGIYMALPHFLHDITQGIDNPGMAASKDDKKPFFRLLDVIGPRLCPVRESG